MENGADTLGVVGGGQSREGRGREERQVVEKRPKIF